MVHGLMNTIPRTKTKALPLLKIRVGYFSVQCIIAKKHVIPHPIIAAILDVNNNMPVPFFKYN